MIKNCFKQKTHEEQKQSTITVNSRTPLEPTKTFFEYLWTGIRGNKKIFFYLKNCPELSSKTHFPINKFSR